MPITRRGTKQAKIEDVTEADQSGRRETSTIERASTKTKDTREQAMPSKRKTAPDAKSEPRSKKKRRQKRQQHVSSSDTEQHEKSIVINRAPVLQLWGTSVASFLYPDLPWSACLSIGNAISTLCAISKGRAIGIVAPKDEEGSSERAERQDEAIRNTNEHAVMGFPLHLKGNDVVMSGKPKPGNESALENKFGKEQYEAVKKVMSDSLQTWSGHEDELDEKAFHMYEQFRPDVSTGQRGWGRKGELDIHHVASVVRRQAD